jgi:Flp pilus assembly protein protease CpaA
MIEVIFLIVLALVWIIFATVQDLKQREVADWLNFSLIIFALGFRFFYSLFNSLNFDFFYQGLIGLGIFFIIGNLLYYCRIFAGGDAKLMISLGTILPFSTILFINFKIFLYFLLGFFFIGAIYGLIWSIVLSLKNFTKLKIQFSKQFRKNKIKIYSFMLFGIIFMILGFMQDLFFIIGILIFISVYLFIYAKAVDETCMVKKIKVKDLREGDWLYKNFKIGKKLIKADWEGLNKKDIKLIQKNCSVVLIRQGIPFVPVFLITFLIFLYLWFFNQNLFY